MQQNCLTITIQTVSNISACNDSWDAFLPEGHHLQSRHLLAFEQAVIDDIAPRYVQVFLKDKLIGLIYLQQFFFQHKHLNFNSGQPILSNCIRCILPARLPLLICGHLFRINFQGFYFRNPAYQELVFDAIDLFTQQDKANRAAGIIIKDCNEIFVDQCCSFSGYQFFNGDVTMEMSRRSQWKTINDYLQDLTKKYAQRAKKLIRAFAPIEDRLLTAEEILLLAPAIERLYWNVVNKQTVKLGTVNTQYFYELKKDLGENFELHALFHKEKMVGFYTFIFYDKEMETHYIGLDYEANKTFPIYFNILFLAVAKMIEKQYDKVELGRTARDAKVSVGALPKQIVNYIRVKNPVARLTLKYFLKRFNQAESGRQEKRNPLK